MVGSRGGRLGGFPDGTAAAIVKGKHHVHQHAAQHALSHRPVNVQGVVGVLHLVLDAGGLVRRNALITGRMIVPGAIRQRKLVRARGKTGRSSFASGP